MLVHTRLYKYHEIQEKSNIITKNINARHQSLLLMAHKKERNNRIENVPNQ